MNVNESKFKVGDWVRDIVNHKTIQLSEHYHEGGIELWKPKEGEWCVFWEIDEEFTYSLHIEQFVKQNEHGHYVTRYTNAWLNIAPLEYVMKLKDR